MALWNEDKSESWEGKKKDRKVVNELRFKNSRWMKWQFQKWCTPMERMLFVNEVDHEDVRAICKDEMCWNQQRLSLKQVVTTTRLYPARII